jgi:hypothetical protein
MEWHAELIVVPNVVPSIQWALFEAAILYLSEREPVDTVLEVTLEGKR